MPLSSHHFATFAANIFKNIILKIVFCILIGVESFLDGAATPLYKLTADMSQSSLLT